MAKLLRLLFEVTGPVRPRPRPGCMPVAEDHGVVEGWRAGSIPISTVWTVAEPVVRDD